MLVVSTQITEVIMANNTVNCDIVQVEESEESVWLKITVEIPASEKEKMLQFVEGCAGKVLDAIDAGMSSSI